MSDPYEDFMHARAGLNEPSPEEPGRYDNDPTVAEALRKREQLRKEIKSSQANSELLLGALIGNGDVRL